MRLYIAAIGSLYHSYSEWLNQIEKKFNELRSYWEIRWFDGHTLDIHGNNYLLDSGAFSARRDNVDIDVKEYARFLTKYGDQCSNYINLDSIPKDTSPKARAEAASITLENQEFLEREGLSPVPVYHKGEPIEYLDQYVATHDYVAIGGLVDTADTHSLDNFFDSIWQRMVNKDGTPKLKVHGFGMTNNVLMLRYPWFSCDSTTWLIQSKLGWITMPRRLANGWNFNTRPAQVAVSDETYARETIGKHYDNMTEEQRKVIDLWLSEFNLDIMYLRAHPVARFYVNLMYWIRFEQEAKFAEKYLQKEHQLL